MEEHITTQWWLAKACACIFNNSLPICKRICSAIYNSAPSGSASRKMASCTMSLLEIKQIWYDLELMCSFHTSFLFSRFKFLQNGNPQAGNTRAFSTRHMCVRSFLMLENLESIDGEKWKNEEFNNYVTSLNSLSENE